MDRPHHTTIILSENVARYLLRGESYLSRSGFVLAAGASGRDVLDLAARERPAAAVLGFDLGDLGADEVCRTLKKSIEPPPAVLVVGPAKSPDAPRRCLEAGCDDYLLSPVDPPALLTRLASHLGIHFRIRSRRRLVVPVSYGRVIREFLGYTRDLGEGGALIETVLKPGPGRRLQLRLYPGSQDVLVLPAVVLRVQPAANNGQNWLGVQFLNPQPAARGRLKDLIGRRI
jgi:CheY-like chemotaxis protein